MPSFQSNLFFQLKDCRTLSFTCNNLEESIDFSDGECGKSGGAKLS